MAARRQVGVAQRAESAWAEKKARGEVEAVKQALGERRPPWWSDGSPDYNRHLAMNTLNAEWYVAY
jgi:CO/xanthine dehydrogenase FAD-binding subunit